jgi:hypothetical protein
MAAKHDYDQRFTYYSLAQQPGWNLSDRRLFPVFLTTCQEELPKIGEFLTK